MSQPTPDQLAFARKVTANHSVEKLEASLRNLESRGLSHKPMHQAILIILKEKRGF